MLSEKNTICKRGGDVLANFVAKKPEKEIISLRISVDTLQEVDAKAASIDISRNELINQMIAYALDNMEDTPEHD